MRMPRIVSGRLAEAHTRALEVEQCNGPICEECGGNPENSIVWEELGYVPLKVPRRWERGMFPPLHASEACIVRPADEGKYRGSLINMDTHVDFWTCRNLYIGNFGKNLSDYVCFPPCIDALKGSQLDWVGEVLLKLMRIDTAEFSNKELGFAIFPFETEIEVLTNPLVEPRVILYIQDAVPHVSSYLGQHMTPMLLHCLVGRITNLVQYQVRVGR